MFSSIRGNGIPHMRCLLLVSEQGRQIPAFESFGNPGVELLRPRLRLIILLQHAQIVYESAAAEQQNPFFTQRGQHPPDRILFLRRAQRING
ncbi:hypothetical protein D3C75_731660 [compost metagenome]